MLNKFSFNLRAQEVGKVLGTTSQAVHKFCNEHGIAKKGTGRIDLIYPDQFNELLQLKGLKRPDSPIKSAFHTVKGGAGKTTLCHAISCRAGCYGFKTLVIDLDKQANLTMSFGINPKRDEFGTFLDLYEEERAGSDINYDKYLIELNPYLHILPANLKLANLDLLLQLNSSNLSDVIPRLLGDLESQYDLICFDLSCDFNRVTMAVHSYVNKVVIPTDPEEYGLMGVDLTYDHVDQVSRDWHNSPERLIALNKFNASHTSSYELIGRLKESYGDDVCESVISTSRPLSDTISKDKALWSQSRKRIPALDGLDDIAIKLLNMTDWKQAKKLRPRRAKKVSRERSANA